MVRCDRWTGNDILEERVMACFNLLSQLSGGTGNCDGHSKLQERDIHCYNYFELSLCSERSRTNVESSRNTLLVTTL